MTDRGADYHPPAEGAAAPGRPRRRRRLERWLPGLARRVIGLLWRTCRVDVVGGETLEALAGTSPFIACYWHRHQIFCVRTLLDLRSREPAVKLGYLISPSRDGDAAARVFGDLDLHVIRGSATRGGAQALREIYQAIRQGGVSPIVTPDGPTGPLRQFKPGVAMLAGLSGAPLLPMSYAARRAITLSTWDRAVVPLPFTRVVVAIGTPIEVPRGCAGAALDTLCERAGAAIDACTAAADAALHARRANTR